MTISVSRIIKMFKCQCICNGQCVQAIETFYWRWPTQSAVGTFKECFPKFSAWYGFIWSRCSYKNTHAHLNMVNITASYKKGHWNTLLLNESQFCQDHQNACLSGVEHVPESTWEKNKSTCRKVFIRLQILAKLVKF